MTKTLYTNVLRSAFFIGVLVTASLCFAEAKKPQNKNPAPAENPLVLFKTTSGDITIELYPKEAPITVANFLKYVDNGFYDGVIFHRVVPGFVVQAGGFTFDFQRKETLDPIKNESFNGLNNAKATLSMARTGVIDSATSQFFINLRNNRSLDAAGKRHGYAVFGKVIKGMKAVTLIEKEPRGLHKMFPEAPNAAVIIDKASRLNAPRPKNQEAKSINETKQSKNKRS